MFPTRDVSVLGKVRNKKGTTGKSRWKETVMGRGSGRVPVFVISLVTLLGTIESSRTEDETWGLPSVSFSSVQGEKEGSMEGYK